MSKFDTSQLHAEFDALDIAPLHARQGNKWSLYDSDVIPVWVADQDFPPALPIREWIAQRALRGDLGYAPKAAVDPMPGAFSDWAARRYGWRPDPQAMSIVTDIVQCLYVSMLAYCNEGEGVIVQTPVYPPMLNSVTETGRRLLLNPLVRGDARFEIDFDHLETLVDASTRIFVLCNPHNPSGRVLERAELDAIGEFVLRNDLLVLADEIHADVIFDGRRHVPFASLSPELARRTVTFNSATKSFNLAGLRAALAIFGTPELMQRFHYLPARTLGGLSALNSSAAALAWNECEDWLEATLSYLQANRDYLAERLPRDLAGIEFRLPESTFLAWLDCSNLELPQPGFDFFLEKARVAFSDGRPFGPGGENCIRLNFATSRQVLDAALDRMRAALP